MRKCLRTLLADESGNDVVEYVVLAALFALAVGIAMNTLDTVVANNFSATTADLTTPVETP